MDHTVLNLYTKFVQRNKSPFQRGTFTAERVGGKRSAGVMIVLFWLIARGGEKRHRGFEELKCGGGGQFFEPFFNQPFVSSWTSPPQTLKL